MAVVSKSTFDITFSNGTISLPRPTLNDTQTLQHTRINRNTRGQTRRMFTDNSWFHLVTYDYTFRNLTKSLKDALLFAIALDVGKPLTVVDYLTVTRNMYIETVAPTEEIRNNECSYTVGLILREVL